METVEKEWITMLNRAYGETQAEEKPGLASKEGSEPSSPCGGYVSGVLSGKAFVEIREGGFTFNGRPIDRTFGRFQPLGQSIASIGGEALSVVDQSVELWRATGLDRGLFGSPKVEVLFHRTAISILDQTDVREGDAVYVRSIHEALR
jgi:hypothetical protein